MHHRPPDTRLLTSLVTSTSAFRESLYTLNQTHSSYISGLTAYASSSAPPVSTLLLSVSNSISRCIEEGFATKLDLALEAWVNALNNLKDTEEEVGRMGRDREILIGRVIKASQKPSNNNKRDSALGSGIGSSSTLSLGSGPGTPNSLNAKLNEAQVELQACEATLINKENELTKLRTDAVRSCDHFSGLP